MCTEGFAIAVRIKTGLEHAFNKTAVPFSVIIVCIMSRLNHKRNEAEQRKRILNIADEFTILCRNDWSDEEQDEFMRLVGVALHDFYKERNHVQS